MAADGGWEEAMVPAAQPLVVCLQALIFKLQPGISLTHKPPPTTVAPVASPITSAVRATAVALAIAAPAAAVAMFAARSQGVPLPWIPHLSGQPVVLAASATPRSSNGDAASNRTAEQESTPGSAAQQQWTEAPLWQQVAFAKDVTMQLRGSVWHGLRHSGALGRGSSYPAVFHVSVAEGALPAPPLLNLRGPPPGFSWPWTIDAAQSVVVQSGLPQIDEWCGGVI